MTIHDVLNLLLYFSAAVYAWLMVRPRKRTHKEALQVAAKLEHKMEMLPHTDPDLIVNCKICIEKKSEPEQPQFGPHTTAALHEYFTRKDGLGRYLHDPVSNRNDDPGRLRNAV